jgi:hypothetical protein
MAGSHTASKSQTLTGERFPAGEYYSGALPPLYGRIPIKQDTPCAPA